MLSINVLRGKKLNAMGRAAATCWLSFGNQIEIAGRCGKRTVGELALHLQCPWRIKSGEGVILGSLDMFSPSSTHKEDTSFEWDIQGNNLFDEKIPQIVLPTDNVIVCDVMLNKVNDLTIAFSNKMILECFVTLTTAEECWRLFRPDQEYGDLVVTGYGAN